MNKEFYERIIVAKAMQECMKGTLNDAFRFLEIKDDSELTDLVWLKLVGDNVTWRDHLLYICSSVLNLRIAQPSYDPFTVTEETLKSDAKYKDWYVNTWQPYLWSLILKYESTLAARLAPKTQRGAKNYLSQMYDKYEIVGVAKAESESVETFKELKNEDIIKYVKAITPKTIWESTAGNDTEKVEEIISLYID